MKAYLKIGDEIVADNVVLTYDGKNFVLTEGGLSHANKFIIDPETGLECEIGYWLGLNGKMKPYWKKPDLGE